MTRHGIVLFDIQDEAGHCVVGFSPRLQLIAVSRRLSHGVIELTDFPLEHRRVFTSRGKEVLIRLIEHDTRHMTRVTRVVVTLCLKWPQDT